MRSYSFEVTDNNLPLVAQLSDETGLSISNIKHAMSCGAVWLSRKGKPRRIRRHKVNIQAGDLIEFHFNQAALESKPLSPIIQLDEPSFSIWYKPAGMPMTGSRYADHTCLIRCIEKIRDDQRIYLVHRIDKFTSGLVVVAHNQSTAGELSRQFAERVVEKQYKAICAGRLAESTSIDMEIDGKSATSHVTPLQSTEDFSLVNIRIETGRKHQIRKHLASIGHPILGDRQYNKLTISDKYTSLDLQLSAWHLTILNPETKKPHQVELEKPLQLNWNDFLNRQQT